MTKPERPAGSQGQPLSTLGRLRSVLIARLTAIGHDVVEEHPDHLVVDIDGHSHSIYLGNLSRALELRGRLDPSQTKQVSQDELREAVEDWLAVNLRQIPTCSSLETTFRPFDVACPLLLPRVVTPGSPGGGAASQSGSRWSRTLCPEQLELALVIDQPDVVTFATPELVSGWGAADAEAAAMANLAKIAGPGDFKLLGEQVGQLRMCATTDSYATSRVLLAERFLDADPALGVLAALPSRDLLFAEPLARETLHDMVYLSLLARKSVVEQPYPLSGEVFWVRGGRWTHIPIRVEDGQMNVDSPEEFAEVIKQLLESLE